MKFLNNYYIDSAKFYIDIPYLDKISIPNQFTLIDSDSGNILDEFKKNSINIPYNNHKIYLAREIKVLPNKRTYEKVMFYFPAKVSPENYFFGITKEMICDVLNHIRSLGYIEFTDVDRIFQIIEVKDLDIKIDFKFEWSYKETLVNYSKALQNRFNGYPSEFKIFNNQTNGLGIQTYDRNKTTIAKPFLKFYCKSIESMKDKEKLFDLLPLEIQKLLIEYLIFRYEFTIKTIEFFKHFNINNKISDILLIEQSKWKKIGNYYLIKNFQIEIRKPIDRSKLKPLEQIISLMIYHQLQLGATINQIQLIFDSFPNRTQRMRNKKVFERCYYYASVPNEETNKLLAIYKEIKELDIIFGF